jgi:hypothetical protein
MEEGRENDQARKDAYLPILKSLEVRRMTGINNEDGVSMSSGWLRGK